MRIPIFLETYTICAFLGGGGGGWSPDRRLHPQNPKLLGRIRGCLTKIRVSFCLTLFILLGSCTGRRVRVSYLARYAKILNCFVYVLPEPRLEE